MIIYSFRATYDEEGFNTHRKVEEKHEAPNQFRDAISSNGVVEMEWDRERYDWCPDGLPEGSLLVAPMAGFCGKREVFESMSGLMIPNRGVVTLSGLGSDYVLVSPKNYQETESISGLPHLFMLFPDHLSCLVTEAFKQKWERHGYTGATFKPVTELDDDLFLPVVPTE